MDLVNRVGKTNSLSSYYRDLRHCGALVCRSRKPKPIWIRYAKENPGERAQMDLQSIPFPPRCIQTDNGSEPACR